MDKKLLLGHELVPTHEILSEEDAKAVLEKYSIKTDQLPKILSLDAACKTIDAKKGQILRITRKSQTAGKSIYYRLVV
ncbi:MAG: DNA-directed RNA polymerase subunit H [Candidatus Micrarchaeota archaeon]